MFDKLLLAFRRSGRADIPVKQLVKAISIDASGPEFRDLYPSRTDIRDAIETTGVFHRSAIAWMTDVATPLIQGGMNFRGAVQAITRSGELVPADRLRSLQVNVRRKLGARFLDAVTDGQIEAAVTALDVALHTAVSSANQLHNLRRMREARIEFCKFLAPGGDANLPLESELNGRRYSIDEATAIVKSHGSEIRRSIFVGEIKF